MDNDVLRKFAEKFPRCWLCGADWRQGWPGLQIHHIARGSNREKGRTEECNLIRTCPACHAAYLDAMPIARQLALVCLNNPSAYDRHKVNLLRSRDPNAILGSEVEDEIRELSKSASVNRGYPYPRRL